MVNITLKTNHQKPRLNNIFISMQTTKMTDLFDRPITLKNIESLFLVATVGFWNTSNKTNIVITMLFDNTRY